MSNQDSSDSTRGPRYAIIATATMIAVVVLAALLAMFIISTTAEPEEVDCGLANDLSERQKCTTVRE